MSTLMIANVYNIHICGIIVFLKIVKYNQVHHFEGGGMQVIRQHN